MAGRRQLDASPNAKLLAKQTTKLNRLFAQLVDAHTDNGVLERLLLCNAYVYHAMNNVVEGVCGLGTSLCGAKVRRSEVP